MPSVRHQLAARLIGLMPRSDSLSIDAARLLMNDLPPTLPMPEAVAVTATRIGELAAEWLTPPHAVATLLYFHGGGYCMGSIASHRALCARIAAATRCRVLLVDYRLAPEHPYPAAVEDALASYEWLLTQEDRPGERVLVGGDSSGGGLALSLLLLLERRDRPLPAGAVCLSPWLDLTLGLARPAASRIADPMITLADAETIAGLYAGANDRRDPLISPLFGNPCGLPPILLQVGTRELLVEEARRFAESARRVGVEVTLQEWADLMHAWQYFAPLVPESVEAIDAMGCWVEATLATDSRETEAGDAS